MKTKEQVQKELMEKFGVKDTAGFREMLKKGQFALMADMIRYVEVHLDEIPQYDKSWLSDRQAELKVAQMRIQKGEAPIEAKRTAAEAKAELKKKFGFDDTAGFKAAIKRGENETAEKWLRHIMADPGNFPQYLDTWDVWLKHRQEELKNYFQ